MPGKVKVKIVAGRNLPVMDRSNDTTDAYVEVKLGQITHKTDVCRKSLNPQWNSEWFRFEMDDLELQDEPLQIRLMDHDTYSANDAIGKVYLDLNPLLISTSKGKDNSGKMISGWIPVFDTMHGIRGEVNLMVKVELFSDLNKFRQSSCGVRFFFTQGVPEGYIAHTIQGFVEELVVNDDPEYQWIDKIRTPRASNEARQTLFSKLSGEVQRRVGLKALELGGNAVIGYKQCFDLEGESGIVVRGIGTAIFLTKLYDSQLSPTCGNLEPGGPNRESLENQPLSQNRNQLSSRSLRKLKGGSPGRTPRLKRSFRAPSSTFSNIVGNALPPLLLRHQRTHVSDPDDEFLTISSSSSVAPLGTGAGDCASNSSTGGGGIRCGGGSRAVTGPLSKPVKEPKRSFREESSLRFLRSRTGSNKDGTSSRIPSSSDSSILPSIIRRTPKKLKVIPAPEPVGLTVDDEVIIPESLPLSAPADPSKIRLESLMNDPFENYPTFLTPSSLPRTFLDSSTLLNSTNNSNNNNSSDDIAEPSSADTNRARNSNSMSSSDSPKGARMIANRDPGYLNETESNPRDILRLSDSSAHCNLVGESVGFNLEDLEDSTSDNSRMQSCEPGFIRRGDHGTVGTDSDTGLQSPLPGRRTLDSHSKGQESNEQWQRRKSGNSDDVISPTSSKKERFAMLRKRRGSRKKDKFSTTCLIKRASEIFEDKEPGPSGTVRIKEELSKLLKRITSGEAHSGHDGSSDKHGTKFSRKDSKSNKSSPYREPSRFFFRNRRRTASGGSRRERNGSNLTRSTSESRSLFQTSLESLQSVGSEPVFDLEDDDDDLSDPNCSSLIEIPTYIRSNPPTEPERTDRDGKGSQSGSGPQVEQGVPVTMSKSQLRKLIKELGYDTTKSLKLYISSMDALLVYEPPLERLQRSLPSTASGKAKPELLNVLTGACTAFNDEEDSGGGGFSGISPRDWNVVNLDSDSDLESCIQLSRTSTGSSCDTRPPIHRLRRQTVTHNDNETDDILQYHQGGTETSLSTNTDSSQSSFNYKDDRNLNKTQPQKRHYYHHHQHQQSSRQGLSDFVRRNTRYVPGGIRGVAGGDVGLTDDSDFGKVRDDLRRKLSTNTTTTDDDENFYEWTTPSSTLKDRDDYDDEGIMMSMSGLHDFGVITRCRSPIPEELSETPVNAVSWINKYSTAVSTTTPTTTTTTALPSLSPPPLSTNANLVQGTVAQGNPDQNSLDQSPTLIPYEPSSNPSTTMSVNIPLSSKGLSNGSYLHHIQYPEKGLHDGPEHREIRELTDSSSARSASDSPDKGTTLANATAVGNILGVGVKSSVPVRMHHNHFSSTSNHGGAGNDGNGSAHCSIIPLNRRSSESDLSTPPKGNSTFGTHSTRAQVTRIENLEMLEFPFITISQFPQGFIFYLGGTVTARSVKLLERVTNLDEPETRDAWWNELRMEIRSHCRAFGCTVVLGYEEHTTMCDDVCILSASGTAAVVVSGNLTTVDYLNVSSKSVINGGNGSIARDIVELLKDRAGSGRTESFNSHPNIEFADEDVMVQGLKGMIPKLRHDSDGCPDPSCSMLHIPHNGTPMPVSVRLTKCAFCKKGKVPDVLLATIEIPPGLHITGRSCLIQAQVFRPKRDVRGETSAKEVSDSLPFLEYELHRRLINKLKVKGMNAIFGLQVQICLGDKLMVAIATGTAVFLTSLPAPTVPIISAGNLKTDSQKVVQFQKVVQEAFDRNRDMFCVRHIVIPQTQNSNTSSEGDDSEDEIQDELGNRNKDTYVLEVDDAEDIDIISMLIDPTPPVGYNMNNIETLLGFEDHKVLNQQMFSQVWRCRVPTLSLRQFTAYFDRLIRSVSFKLRRMQPCVLTKLSFSVELPEQDEMQLSIIGMAVGIDSKSSLTSVPETSLTTSKGQSLGRGTTLGRADEPEMIFPLEFDSTALGNNMVGSNDLSSSQAWITNKSSIGHVPSPGDLLNSLLTCSSSTNPPVAPKQPPPLPPTSSSSTVTKVPSPLSTPSLTVNPSSSSSTGGASNGIVLSTNVSSSCISVSSSSSSSKDAYTSNLPSNHNGSSQSDVLGSASGLPPAQSLYGGVLSQNNSFSVRHPNSKSAKFLTSMGSHKLVPLPASGLRYWVEITPLSYIHGARIEKYLGNLNFFFIRETTSIRENGGLSGFVHNFITEVLAIVRAHVAALGGNAMVSYFMTECSLLHNPHKNQGQCVVNVGGDAVFVSYPGGSHPEDGHS